MARLLFIGDKAPNNEMRVRLTEISTLISEVFIEIRHQIQVE